MKEAENISAMSDEAVIRRAARSFLMSAACVLGAFLSARAQILGLTPFAAAFCAGVPSRLAAYAVLGSLSGSFSLYGLSALTLRYMSASFVAAAASYLLRHGAKKRRASVLSAAASFFAVFSSGITLSFSVTLSAYETVLYLAEAAAGAAAAYFFDALFSSGGIKKSVSLLTSAQTLGALLCIILAQCALSGFPAGALDIGVVFGSFVITAAAAFGSDRYSCLCGICAAVASAGTGAQGFLPAGMALGGVLSGIFSKGSAVLSAFFYCIGAGICALLAAGSADSGFLMLSALLGAALAAMLPTRIKKRLRLVFVGGGNTQNSRSVIGARLRLAADGLAGVAGTVKAVGGVYRRRSVPSEKKIYENVYGEICMKCQKRGECDNTRYLGGASRFPSLARSGGAHERAAAIASLEKKCEFSKELAASFSLETQKYKDALRECAKTGEAVNIVADQFECMSDFLLRASHFYEIGGEREESVEALLSSVLENEFSLKIYGVGVLRNEYSRLVCEFSAKIGECVNASETARRVCGRLGEIVSRSFCEPCVTLLADGTMSVSFCEQTKYSVIYGCRQRSSRSGSWCGDTADSFYDGRGNFYMLLSDGMGTGKAAAADSVLCSSLASSLLRAGFSVDALLRPVNSSMIVRTGEESIASLDIAVINLYSGEATVYKAGAGPSAAMCKTRLLRIDAPSLPVGILRDISFESSSIKLGHGDTLVLMSDGVDPEKLPAWRQQLKQASQLKENELAERLLSAAVFGVPAEENDDMTVMCATLINSSLA